MDDLEIKALEKQLDSNFRIKNSFSSLKRLIDEYNNIEYLSSGTSRFVFKLNDKKVLKLAKNKKGQLQNGVEADWGLKNYGVAADWYAISDQDIWLESELCKKIKITEFKNITGISFKEFCDCLRYYYFDIHPKSAYFKLSKPDIYDESWDNEFIQGFYYYIGDFGVPVGDLTRISSYGINQEGTVVLVDSGLNDDIYNEYYKK